MEGVSSLFLLLSFIVNISLLNANRIDPDQMSRSVASEMPQTTTLLSTPMSVDNLRVGYCPGSTL